MVEVFKTNVGNAVHADAILCAVHRVCTLCIANFDLQDCDCVLRVKSIVGEVDADAIIAIVRSFGFEAEVMQDFFAPSVTSAGWAN